MQLDRQADRQSDDAPFTTAKKIDNDDGLQRFSRAVTINRPPSELYAYWRDFAHLPDIMDNLVSVEAVDGETSDWVAKGPAGSEIKWRAHVTEDVEDALIAWCSDDDADVFNEGRITFSRSKAGEPS